MAEIRTKQISELEKKTWVSNQDSILIVDSVTGEARLADKEELRGVGISNVTKSKSWKTTTITIHTTDGGSYQVQLEDGNDGRTPEFKLEGTIFKWKFPNESQWTTLFDITSFKGDKGNDGVWISEITHTKSGKTTTITIKKTDGSSHPFSIEDGEKGNDGKNPEFQLWTTHLQWRLQGESEWKNLIPKDQIRGATITNIAKTAGDSSPWTTDTYTISLSDGQAFNFFVYHGRDGSGSGDMLKSANLSDLTNKATARSNLDVYSKAEVTAELSKKSNTAHNHDSAYYKKTEMDEKLGKKADLINGLIPSSQLPSYVDDVLEYTTRAQFPTPWEKGKIYIDISTDKSWRWSGSTYIEIKANPWSSDAVAEGTTNKYFTDVRKNEITTEINKKMSIQDYDSNKNGVVDKSEGVVNQNWTVIKTRTGTKAQHTAVASKDANTLYFVTEN